MLKPDRDLRPAVTRTCEWCRKRLIALPCSVNKSIDFGFSCPNFTEVYPRLTDALITMRKDREYMEEQYLNR